MLRDREEKRGGRGFITGVKAIHVLPAIFVVASAKEPRDIVDEGHAVRAHTTHGDCAVHGCTAPVHDCRRCLLDIVVVGKTRCAANLLD